jgi:hypothetical protein
MLQFKGKLNESSSSDSKRHFTVVMEGKEHGLYVSSTPSSAAKKAITKLCASNKGKKVEFHIREITQGSKKKTYGPYVGYIEKLKDPIELKGRMIRYKPVAKLIRKSGEIKVGMKGGGAGPSKLAPYLPPEEEDTELNNVPLNNNPGNLASGPAINNSMVRVSMAGPAINNSTARVSTAGPVSRKIPKYIFGNYGDPHFKERRNQVFNKKWQFYNEKRKEDILAYKKKIKDYAETKKDLKEINLDFRNGKIKNFLERNYDNVNEYDIQNAHKAMRTFKRLQKDRQYINMKGFNPGSINTPFIKMKYPDLSKDDFTRKDKIIALKYLLGFIKYHEDNTIADIYRYHGPDWEGFTNEEKEEIFKSGLHKIFTHVNDKAIKETFRFICSGYKKELKEIIELAEETEKLLIKNGRYSKKNFNINNSIFSG